ncbi:MAG: hypothetical protein ACI8YP_003230, partial [Algoriphagus sp.]
MDKNQTQTRRDFIAKGGSLLAGSFFVHPIAEALTTWDRPGEKMRLALIGTGVRGCSMFGRDVMRVYKDQV